MTAAPAVVAAAKPAAPAPRAATTSARPAAPAKAAPKPATKTAKANGTTTSKPAARAPAPTRSNGTSTASRTPSPESLCINRTQFSYLYCMQEACARPGNRNSTQCTALRRSGDIR